MVLSAVGTAAIPAPRAAVLSGPCNTYSLPISATTDPPVSLRYAAKTAAAATGDSLVAAAA